MVYRLQERVMAEPIKLSDDLIEEGRHAAELHGRSLSDQVDLWARIGKAIERSGSFSQQRVDAVLSAKASTTTLNEAEYAVWSDMFDDLLKYATPEAEAFFAERRRLGLGAGLDENNNLVHQGRQEPFDADGGQ